MQPQLEDPWKILNKVPIHDFLFWIILQGIYEKLLNNFHSMCLESVKKEMSIFIFVLL
jgi:hypothetical protein